MNSLTFTKAATNPAEFPAKVPTVWINGKRKQYYQCLRVEENSGVMPSQATLRFMPELLSGWQIPASLGSGESTAPNTLSKLEEFLPDFGDRVAVMVDEQVIFAGHIMKRNDSCKSDSLVFTALDDREMLMKIPVRGAVVRDEYVDFLDLYSINLLSRFSAIANPNGMWNCVGHKLDLLDHPLDGQIVPVFSARAYMRQNYAPLDQTFPSELVEGTITPWTPRRMLQYFYLILHLGCDVADDGTLSPDIGGLDRQTWRSIRNYPKNAGLQSESLFSANNEDWDWDYNTLDFVGLEPGGTSIDPLDRKLPTMNFQGKGVLQAIDEVLTTAGTHTYKIVATPESQTSAETGKPELTGRFKSSVEFFPIGITALSYSNNKRNIPLMRGGKPSNLPDCNTAYDFQLQEDITFQRPSVLIEGETIKVETSLKTTYTTSWIPDDGLMPAWSEAEETAFKQIIWGGSDSLITNNKYSIYPYKQALDNSTIQPIAEWLTADGSVQQGVTTPVVFARTAESVQLARSIFPRVFRAFSVSTPTQSIPVEEALNGSASEYSDTSIYPQANILRQVLSEQLQFQIADLNSGGDTENWIEDKFPVRVELKNQGGEWQDVAYTNIQSIGNGEFLIDLAEQFNNRPNQCIYSGSLYASGGVTGINTLDVALKEVRMNIAFPMDHRVKGYAKSQVNTIVEERNKDRLYINTEYLQGTGDDGAMLYVDSPNAYIEEHQVNSTPTPMVELFAGASSTASVPLNRQVPPGSEAENAEQAAARRLYETVRIDRRSSWRMIGIRPEWKVGVWVDSIEPFAYSDAGAISYETPYPMNSPILSIVYDFLNQSTDINGLIGDAI